MSILPVSGSPLAPYSTFPHSSVPRSDATTPTTDPQAGVTPAAQGAEIKECETCRNRRYQDRSDDPTVSFQTPTRVSREGAYEAVVSHENEHVQHEQAKAHATGRKVVYQYVTVHISVCPECGRVYVSGGETVTATTTDPEKDGAGKDRLGLKGGTIDTLV
jgi:predicted RNA-binding Zn-ribbon protein involved in translation (DUF1610 family)